VEFCVPQSGKGEVVLRLASAHAEHAGVQSLEVRRLADQVTATHAAFEHFVQTGEIDLIFQPTGGIMTRLTPYFTYEVGIDEPAHPDQDIAMRFVEVAMSDCKYGCKIYADPYSEVRVLVHSRVYGCRQTMDALAEERKDGKVRPGDTVEFDPYDGDTGFNLTGKVMNLIEPDDQGYSEKLLIRCSYIVDAEDVTAVVSGETYQQAFERIRNEGVKDEKDIALYLGISVGKLREMKLSKPKHQPFDGHEYKAFDWVKFRLPDDSEATYSGQVMRYIPPNDEYDPYPYGGYQLAVDLPEVAEYHVIEDKSEIVPD
jgi:hypothetical protein